MIQWFMDPLFIYNVPLYEVDNRNQKEVQRDIKYLSSELEVSIGNAYTERIFSIPRLGMITIRHELLPEYQNSQNII